MRLPVFRRAIHAALNARPLLAPHLSLGYPAGGLSGTDVWIAATGSLDLEPEITGGDDAEKVSGEIRIVVTRDSATLTDLEDEAHGLVDEVAAAIAADPTLGGAVSNARVSKVEDEEAIPDTNTRQMGARITVTADVWDDGLPLS